MFQVWKNRPLCTRLSIEVENSSRKYSEGEWVIEASLAVTEPIEEKEKFAASIVEEEEEEKALAMANHNQASYKRH